MRTAQYLGDHRVAAVEAEPAAPEAGEVQIRVAYTGLCGTDLHIVHGDMDGRVRRPLAFGHEMSGIVAAVGAGVTAVQPGQHVTVMPLSWDGTCPACRAGHEHICQNLDFVGIDSPGSLQELWTVPERIVIPVPESAPLRQMALVEPVAVAVHDVRRSELRGGDRVLVIGGGPIGLLIATVARHRGAEVVVSEVDASRRGQAAELGFDVIDPAGEDPVAAVERWTEGAGADVVFEVSGAAAALRSATSFAKVRGTLVIVAIHPVPREIDVQRVFWRELRLLGARVYERADFEEAIGLVAAGVIPAERLITDVVPLEETQEAFARLESGQAMKVLVDVAGAAL
ncbi:alcohol dehydrogenase catalytic domain-containing protein [Leifsonia shinshuensis]|uniref:2-desacetyl-2-hydroxyethyl bacteriochlorophyllide A dehydrogenase n=1 Tax=Leifsonia shinshuensis TaxID=150026 RepID=A0A853CW03_9MICO|nr:2-desacetyl-2-hydroxyethyl bacteriochlorophyllide A dehydrogenase [Leifsonia shinshuensis]